MKGVFCGLFILAGVMVANAGLWEGLKDENYLSGPKLTERDLLNKAVVLFYFDKDEDVLKKCSRLEELWKSFDKKRFCLIGVAKRIEKADLPPILAKHKMSFPIYKDFKLASDKEERPANSKVVIDQYGKIRMAMGQFGGNEKDFEEFLVNAISEIGVPPNLIPGVELVKYKALKTKFKLGTNLKAVIKGLEKDVAAGDKKSANQQVKDKAAEAQSILSAINDGKSEISENITALTEANPEEAFKLLSLYVKSFPDEAADKKEALAELKAKAAEFKKQAKAK